MYFLGSPGPDDKYSIKSYMTLGNDSESESKLETYRVPIDVTIGFMEEFNFVYGNLDLLARDMSIENIERLYKIRMSLEEMVFKEIPDENIKLTSMILSSIIDPRAIMYVQIEGLLNGIATAIEWSIERGFNHIAVILSSIKHDGEVFRVNTSTKTKLSQDIRDELNRIYPYKKTIVKGENERSYVNLAEESINKISNKFTEYSLYSLLPVDILEELTGSSTRFVVVPGDIRDHLAKMIISIYSE